MKKVFNTFRESKERIFHSFSNKFQVVNIVFTRFSKFMNGMNVLLWCNHTKDKCYEKCRNCTMRKVSPFFQLEILQKKALEKSLKYVLCCDLLSSYFDCQNTFHICSLYIWTTHCFSVPGLNHFLLSKLETVIWWNLLWCFAWASDFIMNLSIISKSYSVKRIRCWNRKI